MQQNKKKKWKKSLVLLLWILVVQLVLANISAALYAYKFTHFYSNPETFQPSKNIFTKTWKLFSGPRIYKLAEEDFPSFPYEQVMLNTSNNINIDAWYSSADSSKGCVIFFHGVTSNKSTLLYEANGIRRMGYSVMLVDFRGHGKSGGTKTSFGVEETEEVQKAFQYVKSKGVRNIILYGTSLGAVVILKAVYEKKVAPTALIADMPFDELKDHLKARARMVGFPSQPFASLVTFWIGAENGYNGFKHCSSKYAAQVKCPVLLQWGNVDQYVTKEETDDVYAALASSRKKLIVYTEANHESLLKYDPVLWTKEVSTFLGSL